MIALGLEEGDVGAVSVDFTGAIIEKGGEVGS